MSLWARKSHLARSAEKRQPKGNIRYSLLLVPIVFPRRTGDATKTQICWTAVYIDEAFAREVRSRIDSHPEIFGTLVEQISGRRFSEIRHDINAVGVSDDLAPPLRVTSGAHAPAIRRQYLFSSNEMAVVSLSIHPADRYSYTTRLTRQEAETI